jgi:dienelactone hydrolase
VSLRVLEERDAARAGRPVQITLLLPAAGSTRPRLTYGDYLALTPREKDFGPVPEGRVDEVTRAWIDFLAERGIRGEVARGWLAAPMLGHRDGPAAEGRFPLVLVAQGNRHSAVDQAILAELLASHGYAVATSPSPMNVSGPMKDEAEIGPRAEEQAADLAFVFHRLRRERGVDAARVAVVAHSFGARGALLFAMQEKAVRALVSLDGGIGTALGRDALERSALFARAGFDIPVLHAYQELDDFMKPDFGLLRAVAGERLELLPTRGMHHAHFSSLGFAAAWSPEIARASGAGPGLADSLAAVVARTLATVAKGLALDRAALTAAAGTD